MKNNVKTFRLFVRPDERSQRIADKIRELNAKKSTPLVESEDADLVIAIGGDGTFIHAVTETHFSKDIVYTGIHTGTLGFLQDLCENDIYSLIRYLDFEEELKTRKVFIALIKVFLEDGSVKQFFALNDVLISREKLSKIHFAEYINGELLQNVLGSGILIATSTGDTAFSASFSGAIDFSNNFQLVCELIAPIKNSTTERIIENPIICSKITVDLLEPASNLSIVIDGQEKDIDSESIRKVEVSMVDDFNYINKLAIMDFSKVRVVREKILGY